MTVYPRGCGGTAVIASSLSPKVGLSPRVRGNRPHSFPLSGNNRSIPAGAGEPCSSTCPTGRTSVYPRGCGGTAQDRAAARIRSGLSPRVRGNPSKLLKYPQTDGSIPAGAGEPDGCVGASTTDV